jgi:DHA1 family tetracycline resistance protein-like MFS transporter
VPSNEQGTVQGALASLASLATVFAPPIAAWSFAACIRPDTAIYLPGVTMFEAAVIVVAALCLAVRSLRQPEDSSPSKVVSERNQCDS